MRPINCSIAGTGIEEIELRIVDQCIPDCATKADIPAAIRVPGLCRHLKLGVFETQLRVSGHGVKAPGEFSGLDIICADVTARVEISAAIAYYDDIAGNRRCARGCRAPNIAGDGRSSCGKQAKAPEPIPVGKPGHWGHPAPRSAGWSGRTTVLSVAETLLSHRSRLFLARSSRHASRSSWLRSGVRRW